MAATVPGSGARRRKAGQCRENEYERRVIAFFDRALLDNASSAADE